MAEELTFVAMRVVDFHRTVPGSTTEVCSKCGAPVWVTPASRPVFERVGTAVCNRCQPPGDLPLNQVELPTPEQQAEVDAALGPPRLTTCRLCGQDVTDRLFILREHLVAHYPEASKLTVRQVLEKFA